MTIPTTINAITETPANTPKPIGNTSSFFPGGSKGAVAPATSGVAVGDGGDGDGPEERGNGDGEDESTPPGGGATGFCPEEVSYRKGQGNYPIIMHQLRY